MALFSPPRLSTALLPHLPLALAEEQKHRARAEASIELGQQTSAIPGQLVVGGAAGAAAEGLTSQLLG